MITVMKDTFSKDELMALRSDLLQDLIDSRGCRVRSGVPDGTGLRRVPEAALDAASRVEMSGCSMPVLKRELETLALAM